jgi:hypothetical protein
MKKVDNELIIKEILEDIFFPFSLENVQKNEGKLIGNSIKSFLELLIKTNPQPENHFKKGNESYYKLLACFIYYLVESNNKFLNLVLKNLHDFLVSEQFPDKIESLIISHEIYNLFKLKKSMDNGDNTFYKDFIKNILKRKTLEKVILLNTLIELGECDTAFYLLNDSVLKIKLKGLIPYYHNICRYQIGTLSIEDKDELIRSVENDELLNKLPDETQEVNKSNYFDFVNLKGLLNLNKHADIEAEEVFKKCLDIAKTDNQKSDAYLGLARIQLIRSNNKKSQEYIDESLTHNPNNPLSMLTQSIIYAKNNSETKSNEFFSSAIRLIDYKPKNQAHLLILELEYILDKKIDLNDINSSVFYFNLYELIIALIFQNYHYIMKKSMIFLKK